jgi:hypothetical protein
VVSFTLRPPYLWGKKSHYILTRRLGGPQSWSACFVEEEEEKKNKTTQNFIYFL